MNSQITNRFAGTVGMALVFGPSSLPQHEQVQHSLGKAKNFELVAASPTNGNPRIYIPMVKIDLNHAFLEAFQSVYGYIESNNILLGEEFERVLSKYMWELYED